LREDDIVAEALVESHNLVKIYKANDLEVVALQGLDLRVPRGEMLALVGPSGAGKSTLLNILGGLDEPSAGRCEVAGVDLTRLTRRERLLYRRRIVGHVWQQTSRNLLSDLTLLDNVITPMMLAGYPAARRRSRATELLGWSISRSDSPAASSSAARWPSRWRTSRLSCSLTSRPASSTASPLPRCSTCSGGSTRS
jgi:ABC-type lipoprotein export system ATPase subunit